MNGIIHHVEQTYRVLATRENRAIGGLSMGGAETMRAAPSNLDKFSWIGVGKDERTVTDGPKRFSETLTAHHIRHKFHETEAGIGGSTGRPI